MPFPTNGSVPGGRLVVFCQHKIRFLGGEKHSVRESSSMTSN